MANRGASSSSASFTKSWKYHVFLSFKGEDTRHNFTDHLYSALCQQGINTFRDDDELIRGEEISSALFTAIEESKISVVVFSKNYASSKWCLDELVKILDCKKSKQQLVIPVFYKVNPSNVRNQRGSFGDALANMECKYKENMQKVNKWRAALSQVASLSGFTLDERQSEYEFIQNIIEEISKHVLNTVCLEVAEHPVGMQAQVQVMNELLDLGESDVRMIGVWGTGGIGKTTIAKAVYNSIAHKFEGCSFLANVRERSTSHEGSVGLQENLLSDIQRVKNLKVTNVDKGVTMIKEWLSRRKVLLVLDDVDDMEQLHKLVGARDWFGVGSRIIITTRDKQLLTAHEVNLMHEVNILDNHKALELFCWHAFKTSGPPLGDYVKLAERAIRYAQGLPLALKVLGCCLCGGSIDKWEAALDGFKSKKIQDVLKISYDTVDDIVKEVFLDIACFFKGKSRNYVIEILEACDLSPRYGIEVLIEKALISVEHGDYIRMHDLLEEMGKDIVEQESPTEAGGRSRLWFHEDVEHVLTNNTHLTKLTSLNFMGSEFLTEIPDLSGSPNLRYLNASYCESLVEVHPSVGYLDKLQELDFCGCCELTKFPNKVWWKSLKWLDLSDCIKLESFPEIVGKMESLYHLGLAETAIKELPASIGHLIGLKCLFLCGTHIKELPSSFGHLTALAKLSLERTAIEELPSSIGDFTALEILNLEGCENLANLPQSIYGLQNLTYLNLNRCLKLVTLPNKLISKVLSSAESLPQFSLWMQECNVSYINSLENFCCWLNFNDIDLSKSNFVSLPVCKFVNLKMLNLSGCKKLVEIVGQLPASIEIINMADCISLERFPTLSKILEDEDMQHIQYMNLSNCHRLCDNIGLDAAKMANILVNQAAVNTEHFINVLLPGSEVPESLSFRKDVGVLLPNDNDHLLDLPIEIPWTSGLENLVLCIVCEPTESFIRVQFPYLSILNSTYPGNDYSVSEGLTGAGHVGLRYTAVPRKIPLPAHTKRRSDDQLKSFIHRIINVSYKGGRGLFKSCGVHLSLNSMPKDGFGFCSMPEDGDDDENEEELDAADDEVRPGKRKKITSLCISM
ncbi:disease resistance protein RPV1-like [Prunus dulcis]|uniref:disease resistance protein RPV1-like n=1 Tax=Prunus dulcis TaxID=3755 RepID=UPI0014827422|nr:disease resistance protein RPV1-like [Prunus dulcis]